MKSLKEIAQARRIAEKYPKHKVDSFYCKDEDGEWAGPFNSIQNGYTKAKEVVPYYSDDDLRSILGIEELPSHEQMIKRILV